MVRPLDEVIEVIEDEINATRWTLPAGQHAVVSALNGHLSVVHASALEDWAISLRAVKAEHEATKAELKHLKRKARAVADALDPPCPCCGFEQDVELKIDTLRLAVGLEIWDRHPYDKDDKVQGDGHAPPCDADGCGADAVALDYLDNEPTPRCTDHRVTEDLVQRASLAASHLG